MYFLQTYIGFTSGILRTKWLVGQVYQNKTSMGEFFSLLNNSNSIDEFEVRWSVWIEFNVLGSNKWLEEMYKIVFVGALHIWLDIFLMVWAQHREVRKDEKHRKNENQIKRALQRDRWRVSCKKWLSQDSEKPRGALSAHSLPYQLCFWNSLKTLSLFCWEYVRRRIFLITHIISYFTFNGVSTIPGWFILNRWKVHTRKVSHMTSDLVHLKCWPDSLVWELCSRLMEIGRDEVVDVEVRMDIYFDIFLGRATNSYTKIEHHHPLLIQ